MNEIRISLTEMDFRRLVAGRVIDHEVKPIGPIGTGEGVGEAIKVKIFLEDIGYEQMQKFIPGSRGSRMHMGYESLALICTFCEVYSPVGCAQDHTEASDLAECRAREIGWVPLESPGMPSGAWKCPECIKAGF